MKDYENNKKCTESTCEYFDERMELNCAYSEDNSECIKTIKMKAKKYFDKEYGNDHIKAVVDLKDLESLYRLMQEYADEQLRLYGVVGSCVDKDELISDLDDRRAVGVEMNEDMWYFCRKQTAEYLLDKYKLLRK